MTTTFMTKMDGLTSLVLRSTIAPRSHDDDGDGRNDDVFQDSSATGLIDVCCGVGPNPSAPIQDQEDKPTDKQDNCPQRTHPSNDFDTIDLGQAIEYVLTDAPTGLDTNPERHQAESFGDSGDWPALPRDDPSPLTPPERGPEAAFGVHGTAERPGGGQ